MAIVTLSDVKAELGIISDDDDALIQSKIEAAQAHIEKEIGYLIPSTVPADLVAALKMLACHFYENREASVVGVSAQILPLGVTDILANHRNYWGVGHG